MRNDEFWGMRTLVPNASSVRARNTRVFWGDENPLHSSGEVDSVSRGGVFGWRYIRGATRNFWEPQGGCPCYTQMLTNILMKFSKS